jgi:hypothetical protein
MLDYTVLFMHYRATKCCTAIILRRWTAIVFDRHREIGDRNIIDLLIDKGPRLGTVDRPGRTLLHHSARLGYGAATELLVDREAVVDGADNNGRTARDPAGGGLGRAIKVPDSEEVGF